MKTEEVMGMDIVQEVFDKIDIHTKNRMLKSAIASSLYGAVSSGRHRDDPTIDVGAELDKLFHKAQSMMRKEEAHKWTAEIQEKFGIDSRSTHTVRGPRRVVADFLHRTRN